MFRKRQVSGVCRCDTGSPQRSADVDLSDSVANHPEYNPRRPPTRHSSHLGALGQDRWRLNRGTGRFRLVLNTKERGHRAIRPLGAPRREC